MIRITLACLTVKGLPRIAPTATSFPSRSAKTKSLHADVLGGEGDVDHDGHGRHDHAENDHLS
jgi:hypothetical protein